MRTQQDIQRDAADLKLQDTIILIYKEYPELDINDVCILLSKRLNSELNMMRKHYEIKEKEDTNVQL